MPPAQYEFDCVKAARDLWELGRPMAKENCPFADVLLAEGYALPAGRDQFGRSTIEIDPGPLNGFFAALVALSHKCVQEARDTLGPNADEDDVSAMAHRMMCDGLGEPN